MVAQLPVGAGPRFLAVGEGSVWVLNQADGTVSRVDPTTNAVVATITVNSGAVDGSGSVAADADATWISAHDVASVWRLPSPPSGPGYGG